MANLTDAQILTKYNDSYTGLFKDNTNKEIVPNRPRSLVTDLTDSFFNLNNNAYTGAKGQRAGVTAPASLKDIVTTTLSLGVLITFTDSTASNVVRIYELTNETTAESSPTVIRPNDYATTTNERVWRLRVTADVDSDTGGGGGASDWGDLGGTITDQTDLVTYVDAEIAAAIAGLTWKDAVRAATTVAGTLATSFENGDTVDGVVLATGDRLLIKNQASAIDNGIYIVAASGAPTRSTDADAAAELEGAAVSVAEGTTNANTSWIQTTDGITLGVSNIVWAAFGTTVPDADASTKGIAKLYTTPDGTNTDGSVHQSGLNSKFRSTRTVTGTDAIVQGDDNSFVIFNSATPFNFTLDQLTANSKCSFMNIGAGAVTFVNGSGVTTSGTLVLSGSVGTTYPTAVVFYHTATTPRIINSGPNDLIIASADTSGGTVTLDFNNEKERIFVGSASFATPKTIDLDNDGNALLFSFVVTITNVAAVLTFPTTFTMPATDSRWADAGHTFTVPTGATGKYEFTAMWDGTDWLMKCTNQYS